MNINKAYSTILFSSSFLLVVNFVDVSGVSKSYTEIIISLCVVCGVTAYISDTTCTYCGCDQWVPYEDEKCVKLIRVYSNRDKAEEICNKERLQTESFVPTLVSIKSAAEQDYLTEYVFNISEVQVDVWIGAKRNENGSQFIWNDGSRLDFTNWAEPISEEIGRDCVLMKSRLTKQISNISNLNNRAIDGKWKDVTCQAGNWVLCQKLQTWSFPQLQKSFLDERKKMKDSLEAVTKQLKDSQDEFRGQFTNLQQNPVPIGFIYVQLPGQPEPAVLWPTVVWGDVSSVFAGLFFRVLGGGSAAFDDIQEENSPRLNEAKTFKVGNDYTHESIIYANNAWNGLGLWSGSNAGGNPDYYAMSFKVSSGEVRPRNQAMRIWKRTE